MKNRLLLFSVFISLFAIAFTVNPFLASGVLEGKVTDDATGEGMIEAQILLIQDGNFIAGTTTDFDGNYHIDNIPFGVYDIKCTYLGYKDFKLSGLPIRDTQLKTQNISLSISSEILESVCIKAYKAPLIEMDCTTQGKTVTSQNIRSSTGKKFKKLFSRFKRDKSSAQQNANSIAKTIPRNPNHSNSNVSYEMEEVPLGFHDNEEYEQLVKNQFINPIDEALSTFSIDVDRAGYSNMRRFIDNGTMPPVDAIRVEEMINYFNYDYDQPENDDPISLQSTLTDCPWNSQHELLHIGLQGKDIDKDKLPASNLVFLIDVSGSMNSINKLPLVKASFKMLINNLREEDRVAIVTYAGRAGLALESTSIKDKAKILRVVESLGAGGSTAGAEGIKTAYQISKDNFIDEGNNRVILATDGDFNVGISDVDDLESLIEKKRKTGIFLSVLGYGMGNYKDHKMQTLADKGNGNHAYIDNIQEARKVFVTEFGGTLFTIAKDVKLQIEFNPAHVQAYRLVGYENRLLDKEDFNDDTKDAGELGAGHVVTAIYEIVKTGTKSSVLGQVDELKYQEVEKVKDQIKNHTDELATIKFRYKKPDGKKSKKVVDVIPAKTKSFKKCNDDLRFSVAVAQFGMLLRDSKYIHEGTLKEVIDIASSAKGDDEEGYRAEFVRLAKSVGEIDSVLLTSKD